jgi:hypothetical protein
MKKNTLILVLSFVFLQALYAQNFEWATQAGGWSVTNKGLYIKSDSKQKVYVMGQYYHYLDSYPSGAFSSKFNSDGSVGFIATTSDYNYSYRVLGQDSSGNYYVYGYFGGYSLTMGNVTVKNPSGNGGSFIAKFSSLDEELSNCIWADFLSKYPSMAYCIDNAGNVYLTRDAMLYKYGTNGSFLWSRSTGDRGGGNIVIDKAGNINITGELGNGEITIGTGPNSVIFNSVPLHFIAQFDSLGNIKWAQQVPVGGVKGIDTDSDNNIYVIASGQTGISLYKYNINGDTIWYKNAKGGRVNDIAIDIKNNIFITGTISSNATFDDIIVTNLSYTNNMFVAKYNTEGEVQWVANAEALEVTAGRSHSFGNSICADDNGNVWVTGSIDGNVKFGDTVLSSNSLADEVLVFVAKIKDNQIITGLTRSENLQHSLIVYPNPASDQLFITLSSKNTESVSVKLINLTGSVVYQFSQKNSTDFFQKQIDISKLVPGVYFIELQTEKERLVKKVVVSK